MTARSGRTRPTHPAPAQARSARDVLRPVGRHEQCLRDRGDRLRSVQQQLTDHHAGRARAGLERLAHGDAPRPQPGCEQGRLGALPAAVATFEHDELPTRQAPSRPRGCRPSSGSAIGDGSTSPSGRIGSIGPSCVSGASPRATDIRSALRIERHATKPATKVISPPPQSAMRTPGKRVAVRPDRHRLVREQPLGDPVPEVGPQRRDGERDEQAQTHDRVERRERAATQLVADVLLQQREPGDVRTCPRTRRRHR